MIRNYTAIEIETPARRYQFVCDPQSPIDEVLSALKQMTDYAETVKNAPAPEQPKQEQVPEHEG